MSMANETLSALISEFRQYGDFPFIGSDAVNRLRDVIVSLTGGAVNPPLDQLGNNHTYWLAVTMDYMNNNSGSGGKPAASPFLVATRFSDHVVLTFSAAFSGKWKVYSVSSGGVQTDPTLISPASGNSFSLATVFDEIIIASSLAEAQIYWGMIPGTNTDTVWDLTLGNIGSNYASLLSTIYYFPSSLEYDTSGRFFGPSISFVSTKETDLSGLSTNYF